MSNIEDHSSPSSKLRIQQNHPEDEGGSNDANDANRAFVVYILLLLMFLTLQFGHGANIGVAMTLPGDSNAMNLALGSWVLAGVSLGLAVTPCICKKFGVFRVCLVFTLIDLFCILLMLIPDMPLQGLYLARFLVGFFEAPILPFLQEWLARFGKQNWNVWNTVMHATVPVGENIGYLLAHELMLRGSVWQYAFAGQAIVLTASCAAVVLVGGRKFLDVTSRVPTSNCIELASPGTPEINTEISSNRGTEEQVREDADSGDERGRIAENGVEYPMTERWSVFWFTNVSLAGQLGFFSGCKYVVPGWATRYGFTMEQSLFAFSLIAVLAPAIGGGLAMSGTLVRPDRWSHHKRTLGFLTVVSGVAMLIAFLLPVMPKTLFWISLFFCFAFAGGVYPAAQGIINISLTESRVIEASVYQTQCNNLLFGMPIPFVIGKILDLQGAEFAFLYVMMIEGVAFCGFLSAVLLSTLTDQRGVWNRIFAAHSERLNQDLEMTSELHELSSRR
eukprot:TRINITY_DN74947_c0_g1_i1.p1 TRINITY_DN74947_c0_g1~~TRINITY_DN74947_c0_g1_i1.p1  ORF type:complete len:504 (+),score=64.71 TRINITY_DN74947_c0_g1_i1:239-1750(+)